jgi:hypothetical protein
MQKKTRSLLEELDSMYVARDSRWIIETRAANIIASAIRLLEQIDASYNTDDAQNLQRKLLNAINQRDPGKFTRTVRKTDANT